MFGIWDKISQVSFQKHDEIAPTTAIYSKFPENHMQLLVNYTLHESSFIVSYLQAFLSTFQS